MQNYCKYGHYEEFNEYLPECINERLWVDLDCVRCGRGLEVENGDPKPVCNDCLVEA